MTTLSDIRSKHGAEVLYGSDRAQREPGDYMSGNTSLSFVELLCVSSYTSFAIGISLCSVWILLYQSVVVRGIVILLRILEDA